jgi:hypothetical protein
MGAKNQVGIGLSYRPTRLHSLAELVPWNRFLGSLKVKKIRALIWGQFLGMYTEGFHSIVDTWLAYIISSTSRAENRTINFRTAVSTVPWKGTGSIQIEEGKDIGERVIRIGTPCNIYYW